MREGLPCTRACAHEGAREPDYGPSLGSRELNFMVRLMREGRSCTYPCAAGELWGPEYAPSLGSLGAASTLHVMMRKGQ